MSEEASAPAHVPSSDEQNLVVSFIQFIRHKVSGNQCSPDQMEAMEVAVQCLESAFGVNDANYAFQPSRPLLEIFRSAEGLPTGETHLPEPTEAEIAQANKYKEEGNDLMKASQFDSAVQKYNDAIKLNRDPIYFCNRAAAYCRLEQYDLAIQDCRTALALDPKYSKAYGRMGLALSCQNRYDQAVEAYKKALELDPNQESYKNNLKIAQDKLKELESAVPQTAQDPLSAMFGNPNTPGGMDFASFLNSPQMRSMAESMMQDPNITNMMQNLMSGNGGGLSGLMQMGQQMAQQMEQMNPDLVNQLRSQFGQGPPGSGGNGNEGDGKNNDQTQPPAP